MRSPRCLFTVFLALFIARALAWDSNERARLRQEAEAANVTIELRPCQRTSDYTLQASAFTGLR